MIRLLPFVIEFALLVFCLIDAIQSPDDEIRNLPKFGWIILILIIPLVGCVAWLAVGRPVRVQTQTWRYGGGFPEAERPADTVADVDRRLEAELARVDREHEEMLRRWQADLERRESLGGSASGAENEEPRDRQADRPEDPGPVRP